MHTVFGGAAKRMSAGRGVTIRREASMILRRTVSKRLPRIHLGMATNAPVIRAKGKPP